MKKAISLILCIVIVLSTLGICALADTGIESRLNNVALIDSYFAIQSDGTAVARATYNGDSEVITGATIKIKIQKQFLFFFWTDVVEWTDETDQFDYTVAHSTKVDSGTYKAIIEYNIRGTAGEPDVKTDEIQRTY